MHTIQTCDNRLETAFNDNFGCNAFNGSRTTNARKMLLVAHSTCVALGGLTYRGRSISSGSINNPYAANEPACGKDSNFHGQFDRQGRKYTARSDSFIETKSVHVTSNSDRSMFVVNKCPSYGKDNLFNANTDTVKLTLNGHDRFAPRNIRPEVQEMLDMYGYTAADLK